MQGVRHHLLFEFFEKLFAALAFGAASVLSPVALFPLLGRRVAWRRHAPTSDLARILAFREITLFLAIAVGAWCVPLLKLIPFEPVILSALFLILSIGFMLLAERSTGALVPRFQPQEWRGPSLRNLLGWLILGLTLSAFWRNFAAPTILGAALLAIAFAGIPVVMAYRRGEPGLLIPGSAITLLGFCLWNPWVAAAGLGWLIPTSVLVTHNLKSSFALRSLVCWLGAWAGLYAPTWVVIVGGSIILILTLEMWRFVLRLMVYLPLSALHRFKIYGSENYGADGAGIVMSNHVSLADGFLLGAATQRMVRFMVFDAYYNHPVTRFGLNLFRTIPVSQGARRDVIESLRSARAVIEQGHFAGIFPEGGITRSGHLHAFQKGFTRIVAGTRIPIIPAYMNGLWNNLLSMSEKKLTLRIGRFFQPLEIEYGAPLPPTVSAKELWRVVKSLEVNAAFRDVHRAPILPVAFLKAAGSNESGVAVVAKGQSLRYSDLASSALLFSRHINRRLKRKARIGVFLPDGIDKIIAHLSIVMAGHVAMEIPELPLEDFESYVNGHGLGTLITSQSYIEAHDIPKHDNMFFIGRILEKLDSRENTRTWLYRKLSPQFAWKQVCTYSMRKDSAAAIVGSLRGAVVLSHRGLWSAAHAARRVLWFKPGVTVRNRLPLHRAVSLSLGFWMPLLNGATLVFDNQPVDFEILDAADWQLAHPDSKHVLLVEDEHHTTEAQGERYLPVFELPEVSGAVAISSPPVDFMGEVQSGTKAGTLGQMPFGLELQETEMGIKVRTPARLLRYLDTNEGNTQARIEEWFDVPAPLSLNDQWFVERRSTSALQTSSTQAQDQTT